MPGEVERVRLRESVAAILAGALPGRVDREANREIEDLVLRLIDARSSSAGVSFKERLAIRARLRERLTAVGLTLEGMRSVYALIALAP